MTLRTFLTIFAVIAALFGIGFVLAPNEVLASYGVPASPHMAVMGRLFGGALLGYAAIQWFARDFRDESAMSSVLIGVGIADAIGFFVALSATLSGTINAMGWSTVLIYLCGAAGCGYFLRNRPGLLAGARQ